MGAFLKKQLSYLSVGALIFFTTYLVSVAIYSALYGGSYIHNIGYSIGYLVGTIEHYL